jgi:hypothetical protein
MYALVENGAIGYQIFYVVFLVELSRILLGPNILLLKIFTSS